MSQIAVVNDDIAPVAFLSLGSMGSYNVRL